MALREYLPSVQFTLISLSIALSAGLVVAAQTITHPKETTANVVSDTPSTSFDTNWQEALLAIQEQNASTSLNSPSSTAVDQLLTAAQSSNLTDTVGRTLLINLSNAKSQGLGSDIPTQSQIIAAATAQLGSEQKKFVPHTRAELTMVESTSESLHAYGNDVMMAITDHPGASSDDTLLNIGFAIDTANKSYLAKLPPIGREYSALAKDLLEVPVPETLAPLHLSIVNNFELMAETYPDMAQMFVDPLRGLAALQLYEGRASEISRVFTNVAQTFIKGGILFTKDEPGKAWGVLVSQSL